MELCLKVSRIVAANAGKVGIWRSNIGLKKVDGNNSNGDPWELGSQSLAIEDE